MLLLGLRNEADDHGVFEWRPVSLKLRVLPADNVDIGALLEELVLHHQVVRFEANGASYGVCLVWGQTSRHPSYRYPEPPAGLQQVDVGGSTHAGDRNPTDTGGSTHAVGESESESESEGVGRAQARETPPPKDLPDEWREEAQRQHTDAGKPPVDLDRQYTRLRNKRGKERHTLAEWRGIWLSWALDGHDAPSGHGDAPPAETSSSEASAESRARYQAATWDRPVDWWRKFDPSQQTKARKWVEHGEWRGITGPPGSPNCAIDPELAAAAVAERAKRLREQPTLLLPSNGGADAAEAGGLKHKPKQGDRDPRTTPPPGKSWPGDTWAQPQQPAPEREAG